MTKLEELIQVRCEPELKDELARLALNRRMPAAQYIRDVLWRHVEGVRQQPRVVMYEPQ
jgi:predicted DNA-binding protein